MHSLAVDLLITNAELSHVSARQSLSNIPPPTRLALGEALVEPPPRSMVWGYLKSELQALPLEPDHNYSVGRKLDSDLVLKVRRPACLTRLSRALLNT